MKKIPDAMLQDIEDIEFDGITGADVHDFCDAYITSASWRSTGESLTDEELDSLDSQFVYEALMKHLY